MPSLLCAPHSGGNYSSFNEKLGVLNATLTNTPKKNRCNPRKVVCPVVLSPCCSPLAEAARFLTALPYFLLASPIPDLALYNPDACDLMLAVWLLKIARRKSIWIEIGNLKIREIHLSANGRSSYAAGDCQYVL
ncbi:MAG: hypothetical protein R3C59_06660 [Planctomycetaceae bacterium]